MRRRHKRLVRAFGKIIAGICWGAALRLSGASLEAIVWLAIAALSLVAVGHIVFDRPSRFYRGELGLPMIGLVLIGLALGRWFADMILAAQGL